MRGIMSGEHAVGHSEVPSVEVPVCEDSEGVRRGQVGAWGLMFGYHAGVPQLSSPCFVMHTCMQYTGMRWVGSGDRCDRHSGVDTFGVR
jgi:hypothetical protein